MTTKPRIWQMLDHITSVLSLSMLVFVGWKVANGRSLFPSSEARQQIEAVNGITTTVTDTARLPADAKVIVVEFSDYQCPWCGRYARELYPSVEKNYIETQRIGYIVRAYPIEEIHPLALRAAQAAECADRQGRFWVMHHRLFVDQRLDADSIWRDASELGLDVPRFRECVNGETIEQIRADQVEAKRLGVRATPTFFIGLRSKSGEIELRQRIDGFIPYDVFKTALDKALAGA